MTRSSRGTSLVVKGDCWESHVLLKVVRRLEFNSRMAHILDHVHYRTSRLRDAKSEDTLDLPMKAAAEAPVYPVVPTPPFVLQRSNPHYWSPARFDMILFLN